MSLQSDIGQRLNSTPLGRIVYRTARGTLHLGRKIMHPGLPSNRGIARVSYRGKRFEILHRHNYSDLEAIRQCFSEEQYNMPERDHGVLVERIYQQIVAAGKKPLIIDCGANIGASVLWFSARYPEAHIIAVEPAPDNFTMLQTNCAGVDADLKNAGIGPVQGNAHLTDAGWGTMAYRTSYESVAPPDPSLDASSIAMVTIASLLQSKPDSKYIPFLLKIDIEGGEGSLFSGDCSAMKRFPLIIMEPHDWMYPGEGSSLSFFRFHAAAGREFCMKYENIASIDMNFALPAEPTPELVTATIPVTESR